MDRAELATMMIQTSERRPKPTDMKNPHRTDFGDALLKLLDADCNCASDPPDRAWLMDDIHFSRNSKDEVDHIRSPKGRLLQSCAECGYARAIAVAYGNGAFPVIESVGKWSPFFRPRPRKSA